MGRESLYLMAFHIIGFFICNSIMVRLGFFSVNDAKGLYTFDMGNNGCFLLAYVISGVASSFAIIYTFRGIKGRRGNSPWITPALLTKYLSTMFRIS